MKSGYNLFWSTKAIIDLKNIIRYLEEKWSEREVRKFVQLLDKRVRIISFNPKLFPASKKKKTLRRCVLTRHTTIYYHFTGKSITLLRLFDNRQDPAKSPK